MQYFVNNFQLIIIAGGALTLIGGYLSYLKSERDSDKTNKSISDGIVKTQQVIDLTTKVNDLTKNNELLLKSNIELTQMNNILVQKNIEVSSTIDKTTGKINSYVTGENTFCYLGILFPTVGDEINGVYYFNTIGNNPLRDINVKIIDLDHLQNGVFRNMFDSEKSFEIPTLKPGKMTLTQFPVKLDKEKQNNFKIIISTNAGDFIQESKYLFQNGGWQTAERIRNAKTKAILGQNVDPIFGNPDQLFEKH